MIGGEFRLVSDKSMFAKKYALQILGGLLACTFLIATAAQAMAQAPATRNLGVVKSIDGKNLVLKTDAGAEVTITVGDSTRILRLAPGQTDLKQATPLTLPDLQVGDRMLVSGQPGDGGAIAAARIIVMKQADVAQKQQHDREDWQKRGTGGIVSAIDPATGRSEERRV